MERSPDGRGDRNDCRARGRYLPAKSIAGICGYLIERLGRVVYGRVYDPTSLVADGGPLLAASGIAVLLGVIPQFSPLQGLATIPEIVWEGFLGLWLTFKGFKSSPVVAPASREQATAAYAAA
jgi:hypothetical protein